MSTRLAPTPGDVREDHAQLVAAAVATVYEQVEFLLAATVAALARKVAAGVLTARAAQRKLAHTSRVALASAIPRVQAALAADRGTAAVLGPLLDAASQAAVADAQSVLAAAITAVDQADITPNPYRQAVDRAISNTRGGMPGSPLSLSRIQAAQKALDDLGNRGITSYTDRAGRRWDLTAYVEMATRTAVSNTWDDMQAAAAIRSGLDLVTVSTHSTEGSCPQCLPWLGRTLSLAGTAPGHPSLADAKAAGFRHPNCRCYWTPRGAGLATEVTNPVALDQAAAIYKASQRQRALERRVREAHRRMAVAITPTARAQARRDLAAARAASTEHWHRTGLVMTKIGVQRREHPHRAR